MIGEQHLAARLVQLARQDAVAGERAVAAALRAARVLTAHEVAVLADAPADTWARRPAA